MRGFLATLLLLTGLGLWLMRIDVISDHHGSSPAPPVERRYRDPWRRTDQGWVDTRDWMWPEPQWTPPAGRLHPLLVAAAVLLISTAALLASTEDARPRKK